MNIIKIKGRPKFSSAQFLGYVLWKQTDGFHLRWNTKGDKVKTFQGKITYQTKLKITKIALPKTEIKFYEYAENTIQWKAIEKGNINGFDFFTTGDFALELRINNKKIKPKSIFLGQEMENPETNPFIISHLSSDVGKTIKNDFMRKLQEKRVAALKEIEPESIYEFMLKSQPVYQVELESKPVLESESEVEAEPEFKRRSETIYQTLPEPRPDSLNEKETKAESESESKPEFERRSETTYQTLPEPRPDSLSEKETKAESESESKPELFEEENSKVENKKEEY